MDDVAKWLAALGLSKYAEEFAKNDVGSDVLPQLTEEHLKDLGVSLGDRLRLLEAIDALAASQAEDTKAHHPTDPAADAVAAASQGGADRSSDRETRRAHRQNHRRWLAVGFSIRCRGR